MVESKQVIKGIIITLVLAVLFGLAAGTYVAYLGVLIGGVLVGYLVSLKPPNRIFKGAIVGLFVGLLMIIIAIIMNSMFYSTIGGLDINFTSIGIDTIVYVIILYGIVAAVGGSIGVLVKGDS